MSLQKWRIVYWSLNAWPLVAIILSLVMGLTNAPVELAWFMMGVIMLMFIAWVYVFCVPLHLGDYLYEDPCNPEDEIGNEKMPDLTQPKNTWYGNPEEVAAKTYKNN